MPLAGAVKAFHDKSMQESDEYRSECINAFLGERCDWSDLPSNTCAHCIYGPAAYTDFPSAEELW